MHATCVTFMSVVHCVVAGSNTKARGGDITQLYHINWCQSLKFIAHLARNDNLHYTEKISTVLLRAIQVLHNAFFSENVIPIHPLVTLTTLKYTVHIRRSFRQ